MPKLAILPACAILHPVMLLSKLRPGRLKQPGASRGKKQTRKLPARSGACEKAAPQKRAIERPGILAQNHHLLIFLCFLHGCCCCCCCCSLAVIRNWSQIFVSSSGTLFLLTSIASLFCTLNSSFLCFSLSYCHLDVI